MKKKRLTVEEHTQLGRHLAAMRDELTTLQVQLGHAYPLTGPEAGPARNLEKATKALDEARSSLENFLFREHPDQATTHIYYPAPEDRARPIRAEEAAHPSRSA
ncbi:hypothetical protein AB0L71_28190 [Streptomyces sp. NPDC052052]|uniref:hypothetical protein n=1 Tax=Streptomyces sp. NPDC052052 TaxID=3154756 RepID=UPI003448143F